MKTRTGGFPLGFRMQGSAWQKDLASVLAWATENGFGAIDLLSTAGNAAQATQEAGLRVGTVDMPVSGLISPDKGRRSETVAQCIEQISACSEAGPMNYFVLMLPEKPNLPRSENFGYTVESFAELAPVLESHDAHAAIEGWPGPGALCCTPETCRALFKEIPSPAMAINYDPSHLVRMGIDYLRFLREFAGRVVHVHGKDTELLSESLYELGNLQPPTFQKTPRFGGGHWRYAIPGHGLVRWTNVFRLLEEAGYAGCVSIELEDADFNGSEETEQQGLLLAARFLEGC